MSVLFGIEELAVYAGLFLSTVIETRTIKTMRTTLPRVIHALGLLTAALLCPASVLADNPDQLSKDQTPPWLKEIKLDLAPEYFYWREDYTGSRLLDESGFRIGLEALYNPPERKGWIWASRIKLYYGAVDYNGGVQLASGQISPLKSTTDYYGVLGEGGYGYRYALGQDYFVDVLGRLSLDFWLRHLGSRFGYNEYWFPISVKAGVELSPKDVGWLAALGLKVPVYTYQTVDFGRLGGGTVTLHPGTMVSPYAEAGYKFTTHFSATAFFDSYWFKQSPVHQGFLQPESKSYEIGAKLGWTF